MRSVYNGAVAPALVAMLVLAGCAGTIRGSVRRYHYGPPPPSQAAGCPLTIVPGPPPGPASGVLPVAHLECAYEADSDQTLCRQEVRRLACASGANALAGIAESPGLVQAEAFYTRGTMVASAPRPPVVPGNPPVGAPPPPLNPPVGAPPPPAIPGNPRVGAPPPSGPMRPPPPPAQPYRPQPQPQPLPPRQPPPPAQPQPPRQPPPLAQPQPRVQPPPSANPLLGNPPVGSPPPGSPGYRPPQPAPQPQPQPPPPARPGPGQPVPPGPTAGTRPLTQPPQPTNPHPANPQVQVPTPPLGPDPSLQVPITLGRADVLAGMALVKNQVQFCMRQQSRTQPVTVAVEIEGTGRVMSSHVEGDAAGSAVASCIEGAVTRATFRRFSGRNVTIRYPFSP